MHTPTTILRTFHNAFPQGTDACRMTLRAGNAIDSYATPPDYNDTADHITDDYLEAYSWGIGYLDPESWRYYLPVLVDYAICHMTGEPRLVVDFLLSSLRPPDSEPPKLLSLNKTQEAAVIGFLELLAFHDQSAFQDKAMTVLEEFWIEDSLYRKPNEPEQSDNRTQL